MKNWKGIAAAFLALSLMSVGLAFRLTKAQETSQKEPKFEDPDSPATKGNFKSKFADAIESVSYGSGSVPHGIYVHTCGVVTGVSDGQASVTVTFNNISVYRGTICTPGTPSCATGSPQAGTSLAIVRFEQSGSDSVRSRPPPCTWPPPATIRPDSGIVSV